MKVRKFLALALLSVTALCITAGVCYGLYLVVPPKQQKMMSKIARKECQHWARLFRRCKLRVMNMLGRLSEKEIIELKRKEMASKKEIPKRIMLITRKFMSTCIRVVRTVVVSIWKVTTRAMESAWVFVMGCIVKTNQHAANALKRVVICITKAYRASVCGISFVYYKVFDSVTDLVVESQ